MTTRAERAPRRRLVRRVVLSARDYSRYLRAPSRITIGGYAVRRGVDVTFQRWQDSGAAAVVTAGDYIVARLPVAFDRRADVAFPATIR